MAEHYYVARHNASVLLLATKEQFSIIHPVRTNESSLLAGQHNQQQCGEIN